MQFSIKIFKNDSIVQKVRTYRKRRILKIIRSTKWQDPSFSRYFKVDYGKRHDVYGKLVNFYNDGTYNNKRDFLSAAEAFMED